MKKWYLFLLILFTIPLAFSDDFDFNVSISPEKRSITPGNVGSFTIDVTLVSGTAEPVNINVSGIPPSSSYVLSSTTLTPPGRAYLNIYTTSNTPAGNYTITACAYTDEKIRCDDAILEVKSVEHPKVLDFLSDPLFVLFLIIAGIGTYLTRNTPWIAFALLLLPIIYAALKYLEISAFLVLIIAFTIVYYLKRVLS